MPLGSDYLHLQIDADGVARIGDTRYKVSQLAAEHYAYGWSAEELLRQHPDLRPQDVYAALTYFYDHYDEMVAELRREALVPSQLKTGQKLTRESLLQRCCG